MNPTPLPDPGTPPPAPGESEVRAEFVRAALDVTPGPVPLAAVRHAGRRRRRRRTAGLSALAVLGVGTAVAAVVALVPVRPSPPAPGPVAAPPTVARPTQTPPPVRVVAAGERVDVGRGITVWLTEDGKHWSGPEGENFRSVADGNIDRAEPGVSHQSEGGPKGAFHSGLYYGTRAPGRVELTATGGRPVRATLLELPGHPGWGVWYAYLGPGGGRATVTLYDRAGTRLAQLPGWPEG
ncbi:hypothetical protein [Streptomyces sp. NPDC005828]|uniref:hypothetical protein n=1 Tax=Streptomyces sp. NPDC005828 TaxID=3157071 RepID=UPI0033E58052